MGKDLKGKELGKGIRQKPDGKYYARFVSVTGKRPEKAFSKLQEAKLWLQDQRYLDKHNHIGCTNNMTVDTWYDYWEQHIIKAAVRNTTLYLYRTKYETHIKPFIGNMRLEDVKPIHCQEIINQGLEKYAYNSILEARIRLKQIFDAAVENQLIEQSPVTKSVKMPKKPLTERRVLTVQEQKLLVDHITRKRLKHRDQAIFILETGLRCGEMMGLKWEDVDWEKHSIHIQRTLIYRGDTKTLEEHPPKSRTGDRIVPLTDTAYQILLDHKKRKIVGTYVFQGEKGEITSNNTYDAWLRGICHTLKIDLVSMHVLRHSFATRCIENGMQPKTLQKILGHSSISITMDLYVHVTEDTLYDEVKKMGSITQVG